VRSLAWYGEVGKNGKDGMEVNNDRKGTTNSFFNLAVLLETLTKSVVGGVPCEAAIKSLLEKMRWISNVK
jgi:hypothetical protein